MAYTRNYQWILDHMKTGGYQNFAIYNDSAKKQLLMEEKTGHKTPEEAAALLDSILQNMSGVVYVEVTKKSRGEVGGHGIQNSLIPVQLGEEKIQGIGNVNMAPQWEQTIGALEKSFDERLQAMRREMEHKKEVDDLKQQLKEAQEGNPLMNHLMPVLPQLISGIFGQTPAPIAGHPQVPVEHSEPEQVEYSSEEVEFASRQISRLLAVDPDFLQVLEKLADMAENEPSKYKMAKSFL